MSQPLLSPAPARPTSPARRWLWSLLLVVAVVLPILIALEVMLLRQVGPRGRSDETRAETGGSAGPGAAQGEAPAPPSPTPSSAPITAGLSRTVERPGKEQAPSKDAG